MAEHWSFWNNSLKNWTSDSGISVNQFIHPKCYNIEYVGKDETVRTIFDEENLEGDYSQETSNKDDIPSYRNLDDKFIVLGLKVRGFWTLSINQYDLMFQPGSLIEPDNEKPWMMRKGNTFVMIKGVRITRGLISKSNFTTIVSVVLTISVIILVGLGLGIYFIIRQKRKQV